ncbi:probable WRKY transcription factor 61 [Triticum dicoccoides]|uniref:probable WRKY transcription factor 61 n=1 Tax=Triticum dicoccoides TaxID=85692 RepID=UPI00188F66BF|nr:probable WRKY transcription factor 61 [Triticum dicoccoides]
MAALATPATSAALVSDMMAQGRKSAAALEALLQVQDHAGMRELTAKILGCGDRTLAVLHGKPARRHKRKPDPHGGAATQTSAKTRTRASSGEPTRVEWTRNWDDDFMWTKYGQKHIRDNDHPRHYFRCAYALHDGGCPATRHVQRCPEHDPPLYVLTYFAEHTCCRHGVAAAVMKNVKMQPLLVLDFGSAAAPSGPSPYWLNYGDVSGDISRSEELRGEVTKVESTPSSDLLPAGPAVVAQLSSSADDARYSSSPAAWDPSAADWEYFVNNSSDYVREFFDLEDVTLYQ